VDTNRAQYDEYEHENRKKRDIRHVLVALQSTPEVPDLPPSAIPGELRESKVMRGPLTKFNYAKSVPSAGDCKMAKRDAELTCCFGGVGRET
jgi:hypothetical protein